MKIAKNWKVFSLCWTTYVIAYLCRVNFSSVLAKLSLSLDVSTTQLGLVGSCFFFTYAIGQIVNGYIGERISPYRLVMCAIFGTGVLNVAVSLTDNFYHIMAIWALNGYVQSMMWGPLMRILAQWFTSKETMKVSTGMSTSLVVGFIVSWAVFGKVFLYSAWQYYFVVPAILAVIIALPWYRYAFGTGTAASPKAARPKGRLRVVFFKEKIWLVALTCFCLGAIKESVSLWAPLMMTEMLHLDVSASFLVISIIPLANFGGIMTANRLIRQNNGNVKRSLLTMFLCSSVSAVGMWVFYNRSTILSVVLIAVVSGMMYGCNTILLSYVPISFGPYKIISTLVGMFDFMSYMGAAVSSAILGAVVGLGSYYSVFGFWVLFSVGAVILVGNFGLSGGRGCER